jgi:hypothetical protein
MKSNKSNSNKSRSLRSKKSKSKKNTKKVNKHVMKGGSLNPSSPGSSGLVQQVAAAAAAKQKLQSTEAEPPSKNLSTLLGSIQKTRANIVNTSSISPTIDSSSGLPRQGNPFTAPSGDAYLKTRAYLHPETIIDKRAQISPALRRAVKYPVNSKHSKTNYSSPPPKFIKSNGSKKSKVPLG